MPTLADRLGSYLPLFAGGTTGLLLLGCVLMLLTRSPAYRQRIGELTLIAVLGWLLLACVPLPRLVSDGFWIRIAAATHVPDTDTTIDAVGDSPRLLSSVVNGDTELGWFDGTALDEAPDSLIRPTSSDLPAAFDSSATEGLVIVEHHDAIGATAATLSARSRIALAYCVGSTLFVVWLLGGRIWLAFVRRSARRPPPWLAEMFRSMPTECGRPPQLLVSLYCRGPVSWGTWRPTVMLPLALVRRRHREPLRMVLLHELAHVARHDSWRNLLFCFAVPLLYGHPMFWWLRAQVRLTAELLADDRAAQQAGKLAYVEQLLAMAKASPACGMPLAGAMAFYSSPSQFYRRMHMLVSRTSTPLDMPSANWRTSSLIILAGVVFVAAALAGVRPAAGQQNETSVDEIPTPITAAETPRAEQPPAKPSEVNQPLTELPIVGRLFAVADQEPGPEQIKAEAEMLRAKLAATEQQVRALEEQLDAIKAQLKGAGIGTNNGTQPPRMKILLTRVNEDGSISQEIWEAGDDGRPEKLISKKQSQPGESPIAEAKSAIVQGDRVIKEFKAKDGTLVTHVYDRETGKLIETRQHAARERAKLPQEEYKQSYTTAAKKFYFDLAKQAADQPSPRIGGDDRASAAGLDLVSLATAYADAVGEVEAAGSRLAAVEKANLSNGPDRASEVEAARIALRSAQRKYELLRNLASVAAAAAKAEVDRAEQLVRAGAAPSNLSAEAQSRLKMLNAILQSGTDSAQEKGLDQPKQP